MSFLPLQGIQITKQAAGLTQELLNCIHCREIFYESTNSRYIVLSLSFCWLLSADLCRFMNLCSTRQPTGKEKVDGTKTLLLVQGMVLVFYQGSPAKIKRFKDSDCRCTIRISKIPIFMEEVEQPSRYLKLWEIMKSNKLSLPFLHWLRWLRANRRVLPTNGGQGQCQLWHEQVITWGTVYANFRKLQIC